MTLNCQSTEKKIFLVTNVVSILPEYVITRQQARYHTWNIQKSDQINSTSLLAQAFRPEHSTLEMANRITI